ncbi:dipeptide ABC transporter ATP-binding protein [Nocardioides alcanivorans]|uniref:dipeptide ABC transporter ATP-binding protein n=1 Tax=Nocardioides alcanivorans TaxID=2897352 RepID=UPI001F3DC04A|nr:ABC transporter ATP-binding protein [Nocardioides alcanivorans]
MQVGPGAGNVLDIRGLDISYGAGAPTIRGVELSMAPGEILGLIGESGSGKSTVAMACMGLLPKTAQVRADQFTVCGQDVSALDRRGWRDLRGGHAGMIFQDAMGALDPSMRIGNQIAEVIGRHRGLRGKARARAVVDVLEKVGVPEPGKRARHYSFQLSGGLRQRVAIALALAGDPQLLLADEPTTALDVTVQAGILQLFRQVRDDFGVGILLISHDMGVIAQTADRVGVMLNGEIVEQGPVSEVLVRPQDDYTKRLLDAMPRLDGPGIPSEHEDETAVFEIQDLHKTFRVKGQTIAAVRGVSLDIRRGEVLSVVGESGSGKSTLARLVAGLETPTAGAVKLDGKKLARRGRTALSGRLQMVFQHPLGSLNPRLRIGTSVREPLGSSLGKGEDVRARIAKALQEVDLPADAAGRFPHEMSGGQAQRVAIARSLIAGPEVVILDEPTSALDVSVQAQILELLEELKKQGDLTYLFISHDLAVVRQISDRVAVMYAGEVVELGETSQVFNEPKHWYTKVLLSAVPSPDPRSRGDLDAAAKSGSGGSAGSGGEGPRCSFMMRCPMADDLCATVRPPLADEGSGHLVACHHPREAEVTHEVSA